MDGDEENCVNCGCTFKWKAKGFRRHSFQSKVRNTDKCFKDVLEEQFNVKLTPGKRFLCYECASTVSSICKSAEIKSGAIKSLKESSKGYLSKKLHVRSPYSTPNAKRQRIFSPSKKLFEITPAKKNVEARSQKQMKSKTYTGETSEMRRAFTFISRRQYSRAILLLSKHRVGFKKSMQQIFEKNIREEVANIFKEEKSIFHGHKTIADLENFNWDDRYEEGKKFCPSLTAALLGALTSKSSIKYLGLSTRNKISVKPIIGTLLSVILYQLKPSKMTDLQELISMQLWLTGCKREVFARFSHLGLSTGIKAATNCIDRIRKNHDRDVIKWKTEVTDYLLLPSDVSTSATIPYENDDHSQMSVEQGTDLVSEEASIAVSIGSDQDDEDAYFTTSDTSDHKGKCAYSICFDNVNQRTTTRHQTRDKGNKMYNMVQAYIAPDRVPSLHLKDDFPTPEVIREIAMDRFLPSDLDEITLRSEMTSMVLRILTKYVKVFQDLEDLPGHIQHKYSRESSTKSVIVPIGVMDKDESRVSDMIEIMEEYHKYLPMKPNGDPLVLPLHADGLSCERGNDSQNARINANNPNQQLQGLFMNIQEWHKRCLLLQDVFDELYAGSSGREKGTLFQLKNYFNQRNVTNNLKESFNYGEEFLEFCTEGYLLLLALHLMQVKNLTDVPSQIPTDDMMTYLHRVATEIIDEIFVSCGDLVNSILGTNVDTNVDNYPFCLCKTEIEGASMVYCDNKNCRRGVWFHLECMEMEDDDIPAGKWYCCDECKEEVVQKKKKKSKAKKKTVADSLVDHKRQYTLLVIWRGINQMVRRDAIRENDGPRMLLHWRFDMLQFYEKHHPKYLLIGQRLLIAVNGGVSDRLSHTLTWNRTVNPNGGAGKNIAMDLQMEFLNKEYKESVKGSGGHLTEATISRHSQMIGVGKQLRKLYEHQVSGVGRPMVHQKQTINRLKDLNDFIKLLRDEDLFVNKPGRKHASFSNIDGNLYRNVVPSAFLARLQRHLKEFAKQREVVLQMQTE